MRIDDTILFNCECLHRPKPDKRKERKQLINTIETIGKEFNDPFDPERVADFALKDSQSIREVMRSGNRQIFTVDGDSDKIIRLLARAGYCYKNGEPIPNFKHMHFPQSDTNGIIRKILLSVCDFYRVIIVRNYTISLSVDEFLKEVTFDHLKFDSYSSHITMSAMCLIKSKDPFN